jgi:hypothetical protein
VASADEAPHREHGRLSSRGVIDCQIACDCALNSGLHEGPDERCRGADEQKGREAVSALPNASHPSLLKPAPSREEEASEQSTDSGCHTEQGKGGIKGIVLRQPNWMPLYRYRPVSSFLPRSLQVRAIREL